MSVGGDKPTPHAASRKLMLQLYPLAVFRERTGCRNDGYSLGQGDAYKSYTVGLQMTVRLTLWVKCDINVSIGHIIENL